MRDNVAAEAAPLVRQRTIGMSDRRAPQLHAAVALVTGARRSWASRRTREPRVGRVWRSASTSNTWAGGWLDWFATRTNPIPGCLPTGMRKCFTPASSSARRCSWVRMFRTPSPMEAVREAPRQVRHILDASPSAGSHMNLRDGKAIGRTSLLAWGQSAAADATAAAVPNGSIYRWHTGQKNVERPPCVLRLIVPAHPRRRHGRASRSYTRNCAPPSAYCI
jgi:hypothetical protein